MALVAVALLAAAPVQAGKGGDPDGGYSGKLKTSSSNDGDVTFEVRRNGRRISEFETVVVAVCVNPDAIGGIEAVPVAVVMDRIAVSRSGRFSKLIEGEVGGGSDGTQSYEVKGRLSGTRVRDGSIVLDGICDSEDGFKAKRKN